MNRREWLQRAMIAAGVLAVDPEKLLWEKKKTIFIPTRSEKDILLNQINDTTMREIVPQLNGMMEWLNDGVVFPGGRMGIRRYFQGMPINYA